MNDEEIVITRADLEKLIQAGVEKHLARNTTTAITQRNVFNDLSTELKEKIIDFNFRNGIPPYAGRGVTDAIYGSRKDKVLAFQLHEYVRKVSLSVMGVTKNESLLFSELDEAREVYKAIANTAFEMYVKRVENTKKSS